MRKNTLLVLLAMVLLGSSGLAAYVVDAASTTVVVNETGDRSDINPGDGQCDSSGTIAGNQCSLRAAIEELNALGPGSAPHRIRFNISGAGPHTTPGGLQSDDSAVGSPGETIIGTRSSRALCTSRCDNRGLPAAQPGCRCLAAALNLREGNAYALQSD